LDIEFEREKQPLKQIEVDNDVFYSDHIIRDIKNQFLTNSEKEIALRGQIN
tara:strand:- start:166 stop:318 length:153 start_codon:yes stop_codon:yes gene_type:complete